MSYDAKKERWSQEIMNRFGLSVDLLPRIHECTDIVGRLTAEAAAALKIRSGIPIIAGGEDTSSAAFAMGVYKDGQTYYSAGTSTNLGVCVKEDLSRNPGIPNVMTLPHVVKGMRLKSGNIMTSGSCTAWLKSICYANEANPFTRMDEEVLNAAPGAGKLFFLPYLAGTFNPVRNSDARGTFTGISLSTKREHIARAVMEGVAFEVRNHVGHMAKYGHRITELCGAGGPTRSNVWNQITSDVSGVRLTLIESNADASVGDAMLAAIGTGGFADFADAVAKTVRPGKVFTPNPEMKEFYSKRFEIYMRIYESLCPSFTEMATLS
jgi:xylulokinase